MKKTNALYCITAGNPKKLIKPVVWTVLADLVNLFPFGCLTLVVSSIYLYFGGTSDTLNTKQLWLVWGGMVILAIILYLFERKAVHATYHDGYDASAKGRVQLAEHIRKLPLGFLMSKDPGELGNTMMNDFAQIEEAVTHVLPQLIGGFITAVLGFVAMSFIDWRLSLAMFAGFPKYARHAATSPHTTPAIANFFFESDKFTICFPPTLLLMLSLPGLLNQLPLLYCNVRN